MRIVAGEFRGRSLIAPTGNEIRPTTDRVRESLFSILENRYGDLLHDGKIIDLFAGTGAFGLEAVSRGAAFVLFVEQSREAQRIIARNIDELKLKKRVQILRKDVTKLQKMHKEGPFDIVFADPPYGMGLAEKAAITLIKNGWMSERSLFVAEDRKGSSAPFLPSFNLVDQRIFGDTVIRFFKPG